jgi:hypothetical protein
LAIKVTDTGPGIAEGQLDRLFERYTQADDPTTREYAGAGLGLAICKRLVEGMGGEISVVSATARGSYFSLWVPAPYSEAVDGHETRSSPATPRLRVLVADSDAAVREMVVRSLRDLDAEVLTAGDRDEALKLAAGESLDLILMEFESPTHAAALLRRLRRKRRLSTTPVLALSAAPDHLAPDEATRAGFQGLIAKPFSPSELISAIAHALAVARQTSGPEPSARARVAAG